MTPLTMGVEEEFYLVDETGELVEEAAGTVGDADEEDVDLKPELLRSQVESGSAVCLDHATLLADLTDLRTRLADAARGRGVRLLSTGTVVCDPGAQRVAAGRRYHRIARHVGHFVVDEATCGTHVHVGVSSRSSAIAISNHLRPWLPVLLALSANSPFHRGSDTGYASSRYLLWGRWPTAGPPPYLSSEAEYEEIVDGLITSTAALDRGMIYWDIRPSEHQPTIEIRVFDAAGTAAEAALYGVLVRTLVACALDKIASGTPAPRLPHEVLRANLWRAARTGLAGQCADPRTGTQRPVLDILASLVPHCVGGEDEIQFARLMLSRLREVGDGATRQRAAYARRECLTDVIEMLASQTLL
jgi:glutamate---cysteine ligase / carboxylate-amine ligase